MYKLLLIFALALTSLPSMAREIAGVNVDDSARVADSNTVLTLNGAGVRKKFFIEVYVAALYLADKTSDATRAIAAPGPKRVWLRFVHDVARKKIAAAWRDGFKDNLTGAERQALHAQIAQFIDWFPDLHVGDVVVLDYVPQSGTRVAIGAQTKGTIPGEAFYSALLKIWLGEQPPTAGLKEALLGG